MSYSTDDVAAAAARIRTECPTAKISINNYDRSLLVATPDKRIMWIVFDDHDQRPIVIGNVDAIIDDLKRELTALTSGDRTGITVRT